ncbi:hypothetical protein COLO4_36260 [Corchorus olitorius]|uniref:Uncharacterized protein n=1 Tax=Corchorus olitorius TaxID=93759 RepID=A0A1R3GA82_9ROSI|nr:hypothetical protein COLO4_36260 [Corchorus olitorius]
MELSPVPIGVSHLLSSVLSVFSKSQEGDAELAKRGQRCTDFSREGETFWPQSRYATSAMVPGVDFSSIIVSISWVNLYCYAYVTWVL